MEVATQYYQGFETGNFSLVKSLICDSLTISSGDYHTPYSHDGFYEFFRWDSVFRPDHRVVSIVAEGDNILATISTFSMRYEFLGNNPHTFRHKLSFRDGKISTIEDVPIPGTDWDIWQKQVDSLKSWISIHHPELKGCVHDLSMNGAIRYVKAIELYGKRKNNLTLK